MASQGEITIAQAIARWAPLDHARQSGGRLPVYWQQILDSDPYMRNVAMVIELVFGGGAGVAPIRISTVRVRSVSSLTGSEHDALPLIMEEPAFTQEYQYGEPVSSARAVAVTLDAQLVNPADLIAKGMILAGIGEVSLEPTDRQSDYDRRLVLLRGDMGGGVSFGAVLANGHRETVDVEIVDPKETVATKLPPWVVDDDRFGAVVHPSAQGERIPIVVNRYARIPGVRITEPTTGGQFFVFAWGDTWTVDTTAGVTVNGIVKAAADATYAWTLTVGTDTKGVRYSYIDFTNAGTVWDDSDAVHVTTETTNRQLNAVEVIRHVVESFTGLGIDGANAQLFADAAGRMPLILRPQVLINGSGGGEAATALDWIEGGLLASYPMLSMVWAGGAYGPVFTDFRSSPLASWEAGTFPLLDRDSLVQEIAKEQMYNEFVYRYDYDPLLDIFQKVQVRGQENSGACRYSRQLIGERHAPVIESIYVTNVEEADYVLDWLVDHQALPSYYVEYKALARVFLEYRRGDTIDLTDSDFGWVLQPATIERLTYRRGLCIVGLRVWPRYMDMGGAAGSVR